MSKETIDTLMLLNTLTMFVGGPTTIAAGLATRLVVRGGIALSRRLAVGALSGAVATGAAFVYMNSQGGGGSPLSGHPNISSEVLEVEVLTLHYQEDDQSKFFQLPGDTTKLTTEEAKSLISSAAEIGKTREVEIKDQVGKGSGQDIMSVRNHTQSLNLQWAPLQSEKEKESQNE